MLAFLAPRAKVYLIDRYRRVERIDTVGRCARPLQLRAIDDDGSSEGTHLAGEADRVSLQQQIARPRNDLVFVFVACARARHKDFPVAVAAHTHSVTAAVPDIEIADHAHAARIRRPHYESDAEHALQFHRMRAELVIE